MGSNPTGPTKFGDAVELRRCEDHFRKVENGDPQDEGLYMLAPGYFQFLCEECSGKLFNSSISRGSFGIRTQVGRVRAANP